MCGRVYEGCDTCIKKENDRLAEETSDDEYWCDGYGDYVGYDDIELDDVDLPKEHSKWVDVTANIHNKAEEVSMN